MERRTKKTRWGNLRARMLGFFSVAIAAISLCIPMKADAAGLLISDGGLGGVLELKEHDVKVTVNNGVAVTEVTQVFLNTEKRQVEALYTFPVPKGASVANFSMWINGKEMVGEVLEKGRAREIYNSYKQQRRDPGLLEQVDYKTFEMRIFPINADAEQKVQITYYQELEMDHDRATYVYPLATVTRKDVNSRVTGKFAINMDVKSEIPLVGVESPSHEKSFVTVNHSENYTTASLETPGGSLGSDVVINYSVSRPKTGIDLITSKQSGEDGFFLMTLTTGDEIEKLDMGMDYVFVMDVSGSMGDDGKLVLSRNSVEAFIEELGKEDRFEVMTFNVRPYTLFNELRPASYEMKGNAQEFMRSQQANGGTVLAPAMNTAYKYGNPDRPLNVVILSDGMTEQQERQELLRLIGARPTNSRVFCIGIGNEVNRPLLEQMAEDSGGLAAFISRGDNFKAAAKGFRRKLMHPAATNVEIDFGGLKVYDVEPRVIPNLYHGSPIRIYGRYAGSGDAEITLKADVRGKELKKTAKIAFPAKDANNPEIERMWAWKRIDSLLKQADREGSSQPVIDEIVKLGEGYSIVTEYTSFLVLENDAEYQRWKIERKNALRIDRDRAAQASIRSGLEKIRNKAMADLGPQAAEEQKQQTAQPSSNKAPMPQQTANAPQPAVNSSPAPGRGMDFSLGSGPVGPAFLWWVHRLRKRKKEEQKKA